MEDIKISNVIERSQKMILKMAWVSPEYIVKYDDNFIIIDEWDEDDDGDDIIEQRLFKWDYANLALIPVRGM